MKHLLVVLVLGISTSLLAQHEWPHTIVGADGGIFYVYQPQPDSFSENALWFKAAFSYLGKTTGEVRYGSFRAWALVDIDKDERKVGIVVANLWLLSVSGRPDSVLTDYIKETLECGLPASALDIPLDDLVCALHLTGRKGPIRTGRFTREAPRILVASRPSILVFIDGAPKMRRHPAWGVNMVANSPNILVESFNGWFYLYGGRHWYIGPQVMGPYSPTTEIAPDIQRIRKDLEKRVASESGHIDTLREGAGIVEDIIVCTSPAELIQTNGKPVYASVEGTGLQYVVNTPNDLFLDVLHQTYYLLLSGRWYGSTALEGPWRFISGEDLPVDFRKIPEGSPKDNVLASVPGTVAAREAVTDALLPQTAIISRHGASPLIAFDGAPQFRRIAGTPLQYALNSAAVVLKDKDQYYCLEKGVWFFASRFSGPWEVCTERPTGVELIPPDCPLYFCKYVRVYGSSPDYVYTGYTSGYLNAYVDDQTVVYGTGRYYPSWTGDLYFPRSWPWGFGMAYNPWVGWCLGEQLDPEWFNTYVDREYWKAGWWGPAFYRPPYIWHHFSGHGLYQRDMRRVENITYSNNLYNLRPDHVTRQSAAPLYTDTIGDVFAAKDSSWVRWEEGQWKVVRNPEQKARLDSIQALQQRSAMRQRNFLRQKGE
jgi:hypothetical protein